MVCASQHRCVFRSRSDWRRRCFLFARAPEGRQITQSAFSSLFFFPFESVQRPLEDVQQRHRADHFTLITEYRDDPKNMLFHLKRLAGSAAQGV